MKFHFKIHKKGSRFWAQCLEFEGCVTQADTRKGLDKNMQDALNLYLEDSIDPAAISNKAIKPSKTIVEVFANPLKR